MIKKKDAHFLISRTDNIGDVVLTLPLCGFLKKQLPHCKITFLGKTYTKDVVERSIHVDEFIDYAEWEKKSDEDLKNLFLTLSIDFFVHVFPVKKIARVAKKAKIENRIGTMNRHFHWLTCNHLPKVSRSKSPLHESQLNIQLLKTLFGDEVNVPLSEVATLYGYSKSHKEDELVDKNKFNLILHPLSFGSAKDWPLEKYRELILNLDPDKFKIFITGTEGEGTAMKSTLLNPVHNRICDVTGKFTLSEFIEFISCCDGMVAASTGPLHIASASGLHALGLFCPNRPIHPERWGPVGIKAEVLVEHSENSVKFLDISTTEVKNHIDKWPENS